MEFLNPLVFLAMLLPITILLFLLSTDKSNFAKIFDDKSVEKLQIFDTRVSKGARNAMFFISLIFLTIALARPVMNKQKIKIKTSSLNVAIALDISKSMLCEDIYPNRLKFAKSKIKYLIQNSTGLKISLIAYASNAFLVSPLSSDPLSLSFMMDKLNSKFISKGGTNVLSAINASIKSLGNSTHKSMVLFSDGADKDDFDDEIDLAKDNNIKIYVVNIGTKRGGPIKVDGEFIKDDKGDLVIVKREDSIKQLALKSGGAYIEAIISNSDIDRLISILSNDIKSDKLKQEEITTYKELFYYPLILGIIFVLIAFSSLPKGKNA